MASRQEDGELNSERPELGADEGPLRQGLTKGCGTAERIRST
jgi:hypothetical protein